MWGCSQQKILALVVILCQTSSQFNHKAAKTVREQRFNAGDGRFGSAYIQEDGTVYKEESSADGERIGEYSYIDSNGEVVKVRYSAGKDGFRILEGDHVPLGADGLESAAYDPEIARTSQTEQQQSQQQNTFKQDIEKPKSFNPFINPADPTHQNFERNKNAAQYSGQQSSLQESPRRRYNDFQSEQQLPSAKSVPACANCEGVNPFVNPADFSHQQNNISPRRSQFRRPQEIPSQNFNQQQRRFSPVQPKQSLRVEEQVVTQNRNQQQQQRFTPVQQNEPLRRPQPVDNFNQQPPTNFAPLQQSQPIRNTEPVDNFNQQQNFVPVQQSQSFRNPQPVQNFNQQQQFAPVQQSQPPRSQQPIQNFNQRQNVAPFQQNQQSRSPHPVQNFNQQQQQNADFVQQAQQLQRHQQLQNFNQPQQPRPSFRAPSLPSPTPVNEFPQSFKNQPPVQQQFAPAQQQYAPVQQQFAPVQQNEFVQQTPLQQSSRGQFQNDILPAFLQ